MKGGSEKDGGVRSRVLIVGGSRDEIRRLQALLAKLSRGCACDSILFTHTHTYTQNEYGMHDIVASLCDYRCSLKKCGSRFWFLKRFTGCPVLLFKPLLAVHPVPCTDSFLFSGLGEDSLERNNGMARIAASPLHACSPAWPVHPADPFFKIARTQRAIVQNHIEKPTLAGLAAAVDLSPCWLSASFKAYTGVNLDKFVAKIRFCRALWQVVSSSLPVKSIARAAGFQDPLYFGKAFKSHFGLSPKIIRSLMFTSDSKIDSLLFHLNKLPYY